MSDYHQIEQGESGAPPRAQGTIWRAAGIIGLAFAVAALACVSVLRGPAAGAASSGGGAKLLAARPGLKRSSATHFCNCPPSEAIWACSEEAYRALMNGSTCAYYRASRAECEACRRGEATLDCRACKLGLPKRDFCGQCLEQGLNDVGCQGCAEQRAGQLVGADADEHGCRPSAGYRWCAASASCVRPWELGLHTPEAFDVKCLQSPQAAPSEALSLGGDADAHGCRPSAGYRWCETEASCVRPWDLGLRTPDAFDAKCRQALQAAPSKGLLGGDADAHGCRASAGYSWCESKHSCIRQWEEGIRTEEDFAARCQVKAADAPVLVGGDRDAHGCIPSAGYSWCEAMRACIRPWEQGIHSESELKAKCSRKGGEALHP